MSADEEKWAEIPDFPDYQVSTFGRVKSLKYGKERVLRANSRSHGYPGVQLMDGGVKTYRKVHRLVAETFIGPCPPGLQVRHLDGDKTNARVSNLTYGTAVENQADRLLHGTHNRGERSGTAKLSAYDVRQLREFHARIEGCTHKALADLFGVHRSVVTRILNGAIWPEAHHQPRDMNAHLLPAETEGVE